jgi:hypothetical protein
MPYLSVAPTLHLVDLPYRKVARLVLEYFIVRVCLREVAKGHIENVG